MVIIVIMFNNEDSNSSVRMKIITITLEKEK